MEGGIKNAVSHHLQISNNHSEENQGAAQAFGE